MTRYIIISERWSQDSCEASFEELEELATYYTKDRESKPDYREDNPVTVKQSYRNGKNIVIDDTGEIVAEEII